jgi:hypothetical protein
MEAAKTEPQEPKPEENKGGTTASPAASQPSAQEVMVQPAAKLPAEATDNFFGTLAALMANPATDTQKMKELIEIRNDELNRIARAEFARDFVDMKPHLPKVIRTKENKQTSSKYAPLEDINVAIDPVLSKFGFGTSAKVIAQTEQSVTVLAELWHRGGHVEEFPLTLPLDNKGIAGTVNKTLPHAISSSVTYAKRVAICALLNISTGDDKDGNMEQGGNEPLSNEKAVEIDQLITETGANKEKFLAFMNAESVQTIKARDYGKALNMLKAKKKEKAKGEKGATSANPSS